MKTDILSMMPHEIGAFITEKSLPKYRADQIFEWLHKRGAKSFEDMVNLPKTLRTELEQYFFITTYSVIQKHTSQDNNTIKFLTKLNNDAFAESVLMSYKHGNSICISTQAGCKMGCKFCASAESGFQRNLSAGEYCAQVYHGDSIKNIVLMGCGEPLDNFDATIRFIELITHTKGMNIGQRHITVSTCGLVPQIHELAEKNLQITLAVSLHAPTDEIRSELMPIAKTHPLSELMVACKKYADITRRRITFEYALIQGVNDSPAHAKALAKLLQGLLCHVNLIPINKARSNFSPAPRRDIEKFAQVLQEKNITATIRRSLGSDINAACGQLRGQLRGINP
ncbi:MAG: 23S rRNA (adenine(2503)-C(2))-methyltransferase RlmN [Defluviitaleaceae bacterium]|nr:23S rRNA (adenine(2503)-C(2))-methyltransferase RlmN [Defluviitaleaceae bacterium]